MDGQPADPIYREVLGKLRTMRASGLPGAMVLAEAWEPALRSQRAPGTLTARVPNAASPGPAPCS